MACVLVCVLFVWLVRVLHNVMRVVGEAGWYVVCCDVFVVLWGVVVLLLLSLYVVMFVVALFVGV